MDKHERIKVIFFFLNILSFIYVYGKDKSDGPYLSVEDWVTH